MENNDELMMQNKLAYYGYSSPNFAHIPLVIFLGGNIINVNTELKYQIAFHLLNSLFAFLFFFVLTPILLPISFPVLIFNLIQFQRDLLRDKLEVAIVPLLVGFITVFNVLFFITSLPIAMWYI